MARVPSQPSPPPSDRKRAAAQLGDRPLVYIDDQPRFDRLMRSLRRVREIAFDTEANSMFAYRERLCLLQISTRRRDYVIDPIAVDIRGFGAVLADRGILKVLHGGEFDVLLLKREHAFEIATLFDTRIAAASLGSQAPGLQAVLREWLDVELDKAYQRSDWGKRPLSAGQIDYARCDTAWLLELTDVLRAELHGHGTPHVEEVAAECRNLEALQPEARPTEEAELLRVKGAGTLDDRGRRALACLNGMRHRIAEERDVPPFKVFGNDALLTLAQRRPRGERELERVRALPERTLRRLGGRVLEALREARAAGPLVEPQAPRNGGDALDGKQSAAYEVLRAWRKAEAGRRGADASLILTRAQLLDLARLQEPPQTVDELRSTGVLEPWRAVHYGAALIEALQAGAEAEPAPRRGRRGGAPRG